MKRRSAWPYLLLFKSGGQWVCEAQCCNVMGYGETARAAYEDWYQWYEAPY